MIRRFSALHTLCLGLVLVLCAGVLAAQTSQTPIAGSSIPQFAQPLPLLSLTGGSIDTQLAGTSEIPLRMCEFNSTILPPNTFGPNTSAPQTRVWGYHVGDTCPAAQDTYIGPVVVATRGQPTQIRFTNNLGTTDTTQVLAYKNSTDQSLHWADPSGLMCDMNVHFGLPPSPAACGDHFSGAIPAIPHLHGGEVPPVLDGGPDQWFTSDGLKQGVAYYGGGGAGNEAIFRYPNSQEAAPLWFHDHTLGATRLNVFAGLAGAYLLTDPSLSLPAGLHAAGLQQGTDASTVTYTIPLVIQDRMFDNTGQLFFPAGPGFALNPEHPWWVPEFIGDTIVVNGKAWPYLNVEPRRYRFLLLNGSNARGYEMAVINQNSKGKNAVIWQIATDGGYLDAPVMIDPKATKGLNKLLLLPGERAEVIIDFAAFAPGTTFILKNTAKAPYPGGATPTGGMDKILQFRVVAGTPSFVDASYDPASGIPLRPIGKQIVRLVNPATGSGTVAPTVKRQLTLNEIANEVATTIGGVFYGGGPSEILVNNTHWDGGSPRTYNDFTSIQLGGPMSALKYSELPDEGTIEQWEIINLTEDAHPIHLHLVQFQLINRQAFDPAKYGDAYGAAFPGGHINLTDTDYPVGVFMPTFGPPLNYNNQNLDGAIGGNPEISRYLKGPIQLPNANEAGWKDTMVMYPGTVTRIMVRYAPTDKALNDATPYYPFDTAALQRGYVWHCHIIDHEDNEMMRPQYVNPASGASRTYLLGTDY